jgi:hypothetical protein
MTEVSAAVPADWEPGKSQLSLQRAEASWNPSGSEVLERTISLHGVLFDDKRLPIISKQTEYEKASHLFLRLLHTDSRKRPPLFFTWVLRALLSPIGVTTARFIQKGR